VIERYRMTPAQKTFARRAVTPAHVRSLPQILNRREQI
jgi:hypothetical protein